MTTQAYLLSGCVYLVSEPFLFRVSSLTSNDTTPSVLDTVHQAMLSHFIYIYLVSNFGNTDHLGVVVW